jgi:hypothetical protein
VLLAPSVLLTYVYIRVAATSAAAPCILQNYLRNLRSNFTNAMQYTKLSAQLILILTDFALLLGTRRRERRRGAHDIIIYISRALLTCQFCAILCRSFLIGRARGFAQNYLRNFFPIILLL